MTDILLTAARAYQRLCRDRYRFTFSNGERIEVIFRPRNFVHLAGLRKLSDVYAFQDIHSAMNIYKDILGGRITDFDLQSSIHFDTEARERIESLPLLEDLLHTGRAVWMFNPRLCRANTKLKSKVIFYKPAGGSFFLTFGAAPDGKTYYPETFFLRFDDAYIAGQQTVAISNVEKYP